MTADTDPRRGDLVLDQGGRQVRLQRIDQSWTYGGLLEGVPTRDLNQRHIDRLYRNAAHNNRPLHVLRPTEVEVPDITTSRGEPSVQMPRIEITATYASHDTIEPTSDAHGSHLVVVWFQDAWAFPIDDLIVTQLRQLDWRTHARDYFV